MSKNSSSAAANALIEASSGPYMMTPPCPSYRIEKEFEKTKVSAVMHDVEDKNYEFETVLSACRALATISGIALQTTNPQLLLEFLDTGVCEMLALVLNKYGASDATICSYICQCICNMSYCSRELRESFVEIGVCELLVFVLSIHVGDPDISEFGTCAICILAFNSFANVRRFAEGKAYDCLSQIGNFGFNLNSERSSIVASYVCLAFSLLSEAFYSPKLIDCGADELVIALIKVHRRAANVLVSKCDNLLPYGVRCICSLASLNGDHREILGKLGVCDLIVDILKKDMNTLSTMIIKDAVEAIMHLSLSGNNSRRLRDNKVCSLIVDMLDNKLLSCDFGAEVCTGAIWNLVSKGCYTKDHIFQLEDCSAIAVLRKAEMSPKTSFKAKENIFHIMETISNKEYLVHSDVKLEDSATLSIDRSRDSLRSRKSHEYIDLKELSSTVTNAPI